MKWRIDFYLIINQDFTIKMFEYYIIFNKKEKELEVSIIREKVIHLSFQHNGNESDEINLYANALCNSLDFFTNCKVNLFSKNIFITNTVNEWFEKVSQTHESWRLAREKCNEKNIELIAYTVYNKDNEEIVNGLVNKTS